jgi:chromosome segregation ATPase
LTRIRSNNVAKKYLIAFTVGLALGILGTAGTVIIGRSGDAGGLAELDRANQQRTAETVDGLKRTVGEQRERITELEQSNSVLRASNSRLEKHIGDARGIVEQLRISTGTEATNIRSAISLLEKITDQVKRLDGILSRGDTGGGGPGGLAGLDAGGEVAE